MLEVGVEVQGIVGVAAVVVGRKAGEEELERIRETRIRSFAFLEFEPVDSGVDVSLVDALTGESLERIEDDLLHLLGVFGRDILQAGAENAFTIVVLEAAAVSQGRAEARIDQSLAERRSRVAHEDIGQHFHRELLE